MAFVSILHNVVNIDNHVFQNTYKEDHVPFQVKIISMMAPKGYTPKERVAFLKKCILHSPFLLNPCIEAFWNAYCKTIRTLYAFQKLAYLYRYKKAKFVVDTDMYLNPLSERDTKTICVFQEGAKYLFRIPEIVHIIHNSLSNNCQMFPDPITIKNPYNNVPFSKSILYSIYFTITMHSGRQSCVLWRQMELFHKFFLHDFHLTQFVEENASLLNEHFIENSIHKSTRAALLKDIRLMIDAFNYEMPLEKNIEIDADFPSETLIVAMKPFLHWYLKGEKSYSPSERYFANSKFFTLMRMFQQANPRFGSKRYVISLYHTWTFEKKVKKVESYNDVRMGIQKALDGIYDEDFMKSHLAYEEIHYHHIEDNQRDADRVRP